MKQLSRRVDRIQSAVKTESSEVLSWINNGLFYDDLTDEQKTIYCRYKDFDRQAVEDIHLIMSDNDSSAALHFPLERNLPPMTPDEEKQHIRQVTAEIESYLSGIEV